MSSLSACLVDVISALDAVAMILLAVYALHEGILLALYLFHKAIPNLTHDRSGRRWVRTKQASAQASREEGLDREATINRLPHVTVQLPLYNERFVAERVIAAACALDYPRDRLQVQVLDDSTDDTRRIAQRAVANGRRNGVEIELIHREHRSGFKAGALANGLRLVRSELIALFDADFIPPRDFLQRVICQHQAFADPQVGFVQTRWGHLNAEANAITGAQVLLLDMHFVVDQFARSTAGLKMNFNGSGGIWRREAIEAAGGWQPDTLTEDLDLSYRAQVRGWRGLYLDDVVCPGELPNDVLAFKRQQARWARGSAQCLRKLTRVIVSSNLTVKGKMAALLHVSGYFTSVFALVLALVTPILMLLVGSRGMQRLPQWLGVISLAGMTPTLVMFVSQWAQGRMRAYWRRLPMAVLLGVGVTFSNTAAVLAGLFDKAPGEFVRTPKSVGQTAHTAAGPRRHAPRERRTSAGRQSYLLQTDWTLHAELALALYTMTACLLLAMRGDWVAVLPVLIYACGYASVVLGQVAPNIWPLTHGQQREVASGLQSTK